MFVLRNWFICTIANVLSLALALWSPLYEFLDYWSHWKCLLLVLFFRFDLFFQIFVSAWILTFYVVFSCWVKQKQEKVLFDLLFKALNAKKYFTDLFLINVKKLLVNCCQRKTTLAASRNYKLYQSLDQLKRGCNFVRTTLSRQE